MNTEDGYGTNAGGIEPGYMQPVLSTRRRLQNREAQRRYREKAAKKRSRDESHLTMDMASMSLWDLDPDAKIGHGDAAIAADLNWEQAWAIESAGSSSPSPASSSSLSPPQGIQPGKDTMLMLDIMGHHGGGSTTHAQGQYLMQGHKNQHQLGMHNSPPSSLMTLHQPCFTEDFLHPVLPDQPSSEAAQTLEPVQPLLHVAVRSRNRAMVAMLLQRGAAAVGDRDCKGATALHIATEMGDEAIVSLLLRYGADSSVRDVRGQDALHLAVSAGHTAIVEMMLDKGRMASKDFFYCGEQCLQEPFA